MDFARSQNYHVAHYIAIVIVGVNEWLAVQVYRACSHFVGVWHLTKICGKICEIPIALCCTQKPVIIHPYLVVYYPSCGEMDITSHKRTATKFV